MRYGKKEIAGHELPEANEVPDYRTINRQLQAEINYHVLGRHMQTVRQDRGMTQAAVAEKMKLGTKYYASLEEGFSHISLYRLIQFI